MVCLMIFLNSLFMYGCLRKKSTTDFGGMILGVKIYENNQDWLQVFEEWQDIGINTVFASVDLNRDATFRDLARQNKITRFIILPVFFDPEALKADSGLYAITSDGEKAREEWLQFVCPTRQDFRKHKVEYIKNLVRELNPDGLSFDFIRYFVFWEKVYPDRQLESIPNTCFDVSCQQNFQSKTGIQIPHALKTPRQLSKWIRRNCPQQWTRWKCEVITSMVAEIAAEARKIKPEILINIHLVPWRHTDFDGAIKNIAGQDFDRLSRYADFLSPMTYHHMVRQDPAWICSVVKEISRKSRCPVIPSIQVDKAYLDLPLTVEEFSLALQAALRVPSHGVIFWSWAALDKDAEKKAAVKRMLLEQGTITN